MQNNFWLSVKHVMCSISIFCESNEMHLMSHLMKQLLMLPQISHHFRKKQLLSPKIHESSLIRLKTPTQTKCKTDSCWAIDDVVSRNASVCARGWGTELEHHLHKFVPLHSSLQVHWGRLLPTIPSNRPNLWLQRHLKTRQLWPRQDHGRTLLNKSDQLIPWRSE